MTVLFEILKDPLFLALLTAALSIILFRKSLRKKGVSYALEITRIIWRSADYPAELKIVFNGEEIHDFHRLTFYVINFGTEPIVHADLNTKDRLRVQTNPEKVVRILQGSVGKQSRESNNAAYDAATATIEFDYLNPGDGFTIDFFCELSGGGQFLKTNLRERDLPMWLIGEIVGSSRRPKYQKFAPFSNPFASLLRTLVLSMVLIGFGFIAYLALVITVSTVVSYASILALLGFWVSAGALLIHWLVRFFLRIRIPQSIRTV